MAASSRSNWAAEATRWRRLYAAVLLAAAPAAMAADWELRLSADRHSDFSSWADLRADERAGYRARGGRNLAYLDEEVRLQRSQGPWSLSLLARSTATLSANRDAIEAVRHAHGLGRNATDRQWAVAARLRGFAGAGVEAGRALDLGEEWSGLVLVQALALTRWRERHVHGSAAFEAATSTYAFDLRSDEVNDRLRFPFQGGTAARGAAVLFGGDLGWRRGAWSLTASARDLGWLHWRGMPQQEFTLASSTRAIDAEGFVVYRPLLQGRNRQGGLTRTAAPRLGLAARWQATPDGALLLGARRFHDFGWRPSVGWSQRWGAWDTQARLDLLERRVVLGAGWQRWRFEAGFDRPGGDAHSRVFGVRYTAPWW